MLPRVGLVTVVAILGNALLGCASKEAPARVKASELEPASGAQVAAIKEHDLLTLKLTGEKLAVTDRKRVPLPMPVDRAAAQDPWRLRVENDQGLPLYVAALPGVGMRMETADADGKLHPVEGQGETVFTARIPVLEDAAMVRLFARADSLGGDSRAKGAAPTDFIELARSPLGRSE